MFLIAQTFNSSSPTVHAALAAGDRGWFESSVRAQLSAGLDYLECNASSFGSAELDVLGWLVEVVETLAEQPLSIDSPHPDVLASLVKKRRYPPLLNSVECTPDVLRTLPVEILDALTGGRASLVVQLRRGATLPEGADQREAWAGEALVELGQHGVARDRVWVDPVLLPWGPQLEAGRGVFDFLDRSAKTWPGLVHLVGLSNVSFGHDDRRALHRLWLDELMSHGLRAAILDPFDAALIAHARQSGPATG